MNMQKELEEILWHIHHDSISKYSWGKDIIEYLIDTCKKYENQMFSESESEKNVKIEINDILTELKSVITQLEKIKK